MINRTTLLAAAALTAVVGISASAVAAGKLPRTSPLEAPRIASNRAAAAVKHVPLFIINRWDVTITPIVAGNNNVDPPSRFRCSNDAGCTVIASLDYQLLTGTDGGRWAICTMIDGTFFNHACFYQGVINIADGFKTGNSRQNLTVAPGTHTIQTLVYVDFDASQGSYQFDYEVTTP